MTLDKARTLLATQIGFGGGYNRQGAQLILAEARREHGDPVADALIQELHLDNVFGFTAGRAP